MKVKSFNYENAVKNLKSIKGNNPSDIIIYTYCDNISKSGMSRNIKAFIIKDNLVCYLGYGRVSGCGMNMGFHVAQTIFNLAYPGLRYQNHLTHCSV